jgi:DNA-binding beta-propeller fold protein YncE
MASRFEIRPKKAVKSLRLSGVLLGGIIFLTAGLLHAQLIDVDFNNDSGGATHGGPSVGPNMSGAAVLGTAGDQWNGINATNGSGISLNYANGSASTVAMSFSSGGGYDAKAYSGSTPFASTAYDALTEDYLYNANVPQTITLSGLATNATYNLILYNAADNGSGAAGRITFFTVNGSSQYAIWNGTNSTLTAGIDYVNFTSAASDGSGNLVITYTGNGSAEGDIDGFQIQAVPGSGMAQTNNATAYTWTTLAGRSPIGSADGVGSAVEFNQPEGVAVDASGNVYVADAYNETIRKVTAAGVSSTIAGFAGISGTNDGVGSNARFNFPAAVAFDVAGNLYVADYLNETIRKITPVGTNWVVTTIAGMAGSYGSADGTGSDAQFGYPSGIAVDSATNIYVADYGNSTIRELTLVGTNWVVSTIAGSVGQPGTSDGTGSDAQFGYPSGITVDNATNIYVADSGNRTIRKITLIENNWVVSTIAGSAGNPGTSDGTGTNAQFDGPAGIVVDRSGNLYVADTAIRKINSAGVVSTLAGSPTSGSADGTGSSAQFNRLQGIALDSAGNIYVADSFNNEIRKVTSAGLVRTLAGQAVTAGSTDGTGGDARFNIPEGVAVDSADNIYVADFDNNTIRQISSAGVVSTLGGLSPYSGTNDGVGSNARFSRPKGVTVNSGGTLYVADSFNYTIRQVTSSGVVSTIAGLAGNYGYSDGTGINAQFDSPSAIAMDNSGNLYVADSSTIRKITPRTRFNPITGLFTTSWAVTTIAGKSGVPGNADGVGINAQFYLLSGIALDSTGNIYVADSGNNAIRKITPVGTNWVVTTIAGSNAQFDFPVGIAVDSSGNLYVADEGHSTVNKITPIGNNWIVSIIGGLVGSFYSFDGAGTAAQFSGPYGITVDSAGNLYVADSGNNTIRKGVFTAYGNANPAPYAKPPMNGQLTVTLIPTNAMGQWRFPWEVVWRNSGQSASNLVAGNYPVELRNVPGWLAIPSSLTVGVTNNVMLTNQYYPTISTVDTNSGGTLRVTLGPSPPVGAGWRFLGDTTPFYPSGYSTNLVAGTYLIQFAAVGGRVTPPNLSVQVQAGLTTLLAENYLLAGSAPSQVLLPVPVPPANINDLNDYPFGFNGQLQSDVGYGSGVAVQTNVVLTAAHMVFNDQTLSYVSQAYWYFQREAGAFEPEPLQARGWYVLSGYAAQRTNDLAELAPGTSTPQSRNFDVAALYFLSPVAGGGYGGYLPSDASPNPWLTGNSLKMLVGYPVDGSEFGDASITTNAGKMYQTQPQPYPLSLSTDSVTNRQEVYIAPWFLSYPGNSGGPVYAQFNGYYYPAGVYLGTLYSGVTPYASAVRAIDSDVVNLITNAEALADGGTNNTGGGVITIIPNQALSAFNPGYLQFQLSPASAVTAGAGWRLQGDSSYLSAPNSIRAVTSTNASVQFNPIPGWNLPTNQAVSVVAGTINSYMAFYTVSNPVLAVNGTVGIGITGTTGTVYVIQRRNSLTSGSWTNISTNTITSGGFNLLLPNPATNGPVNFYRAVWLGQ